MQRSSLGLAMPPRANGRSSQDPIGHWRSGNLRLSLGSYPIGIGHDLHRPEGRQAAAVDVQSDADLRQRRARFHNPTWCAEGPVGPAFSNWRVARDSNSRTHLWAVGFQDRCIKPGSASHPLMLAGGHEGGPDSGSQAHEPLREQRGRRSKKGCPMHQKWTSALS